MGDWLQNLGFTPNYSFNAFSFSGNFVPFGVTGESEQRADTILRLTSSGSSIPSVSSPKGTKRKWGLIDSHISPRVGSSLSLGPLGLSSSSSDSKGSSATACTTVSSAKETDEGSSMDLGLDFSFHLGGEKLISPSTAKTHEVDLELSLYTGPSESEITSLHPLPEIATSALTDEGSTSLMLKKHNSFARRESIQLNEPLQKFVHDLSPSVISTPKSSVTTTTSTSGLSHHHHHVSTGNSKMCQIEGCGKGARGASGRCISHGGGRRCQKQGCHKGAEGRTVYCKAHGGGRRCEFLGCTKSAEGRTDFCITHGGGRRCSHDCCTRAARGKSGLCIRHGGGKRCQREGCTKSAEGLSGLCISHGGGRRCQREGCTKGAQGGTMFCKAHGGGKRCTAEGCTKGAEGSTAFCKGHGGGKRCAFRDGEACSKSVHGGTNYCVAHGGGKRCAVLECTKSARGRTDFCVRHGGGKRCKSDGCGKSAQGSTDLCKAHGGGKRCSWESGNCTSFARGKTGLCALHGGLVADKRVHGGVTLGPMVAMEPEKTTAFASSSFSAEDMAVDGLFDVKRYGESSNASATAVVIGEGRVHGGSNFVMN